MIYKKTLANIRKKRYLLNRLALLGALVSFVSLLVVLGAFVFFLNFRAKIFPGVSAGNVALSGLTFDEAVEKLEHEIEDPGALSLTIVSQAGPSEYNIPPEEVGLSYDLQETAQVALEYGKTGEILEDALLVVNTLMSGVNLPLSPQFDMTALNEQIIVVAGLIETRPEEPRVDVVNGNVTVYEGAAGEEVDISKIAEIIVNRVASQDFSEIKITTELRDPSLNEHEVESLVDLAQKLYSSMLIFSIDGEEHEYSDDALIELIKPRSQAVGREEVDALVTSISESVDRPPKNPVFVQDNGRVVEFTPATDGFLVEKSALARATHQAIFELLTEDIGEMEIEIPVVRTAPELSLADVNNLGIKELIGKGSSTFKGSISSRLHNIDLAASKFDGVLIPPGDTFSFNETIGDISAYTGYAQSYIIQDGATVLGDGGGVCQVSTTAFRAALESGLPIIKRNQHSYRVTYYEQDSKPGIDATIYTPSVDLKFENDTPGYILIQVKADIPNRTLDFEFYGTNDGRVATVHEPKVLGTTAPPEDLFIDDPTQPAGYIEQIDYKAWGANVAFDYEVVRDGETIQDRTFRSNYRPWQAKFVRGTGPAN